jgi:hypothetical protein
MLPAELAEALRATGGDPWLCAALDGIARNKNRSLAPYLDSVGDATLLNGTATTVRCHFVKHGTNDQPRLQQLVNVVAEQIVDYCIPRSRILEAATHLNDTGSTDKVIRLRREAQDLFTTLENSGEGGELLLYTLLEVGLGIPQILCKMPLKTNAQLHYNGVDGVHAKALENGNLAVYWGEAKLYKSPAAAVDSAFESIAPFLLDDGTGASERDVLLLRDNADTGDPAMTAALKRFFTEDAVESAGLEIRGACLVGFSVANYPKPFGPDGVAIQQRVANLLKKWHEKLESAVGDRKLAEFEIEVFLVPIPSVDEFRKLLRETIGQRG